MIGCDCESVPARTPISHAMAPVEGENTGQQCHAIVTPDRSSHLATKPPAPKIDDKIVDW